MEEVNQNLNIVIVDDDPAIRSVCSTILKKHFTSIITFSNGADALNHISSNDTDVVLVDLKMPGISGHELIEKIVQLQKDIVIVVITAYVSIENAIEAMQKGASDFLPKPFTPDELRFSIRKAADRRELILQKQKILKEKREMEENYLSFVSHQLKSPLSAAQQLLYLLEEGDDGIGKEALEIIKRANSRITEANKLVNEWLLISRMEKAGFISEFKSIDVIPIIYSEIEKQREIIKNNNLDLLIKLPSSTTIKTDASAFGMMIANLLSNAIKYNRQNGKIYIRLIEEKDKIVIEVEDTGIGIKAENIPRLFSKFYRVRDDSTRGIEGTGLGLAIIKQIVNEHHGEISVKSEYGKFTIFNIKLPR